MPQDRRKKLGEILDEAIGYRIHLDYAQHHARGRVMSTQFLGRLRSWKPVRDEQGKLGIEFVIAEGKWEQRPDKPDIQTTWEEAELASTLHFGPFTEVSQNITRTYTAATEDLRKLQNIPQDELDQVSQDTLITLVGPWEGGKRELQVTILS